MRIPDRPIVTAGLGVVCALLLLVFLASPTLIQTTFSPAHSSNASPAAQVGEVSSTLALATTAETTETATATAAVTQMVTESASTMTSAMSTTIAAAAPTSVLSAATNTNTTISAVTTITVPEAVANSSGSQNGSADTLNAAESNSSTISAGTTIESGNTTFSASLSNSMATTSGAQPVYTLASGTTSPSSVNGAGYTPSLAPSQMTSASNAIVTFANKFAVIGVAALVLGLGCAYVVRRRVNSEDEKD